jgi:uncharacterized phiE125 gp8 family phage protein
LAARAKTKAVKTHLVPQIEVVTPAAYEPVTLEEAKLAQGITETALDADLTRILKAARARIEGESGRTCMQTVFRQTLDDWTDVIELLRVPVLSVTSIEYIADWEADTWVTIASTNYVLSSNRIVPRTTYAWPAHRGFGSIRIVFKAGYYALTATPTAAEITAAREAVPDTTRRAIALLFGGIGENPDGDAAIRYEQTVIKYGALPALVKELVWQDKDWRL